MKFTTLALFALSVVSPVIAGYHNESISSNVTTTATYTSLHEEVVTITSCPPEVTDCPLGHTVTTVVGVVYTTTYCPASTTPPFVTHVTTYKPGYYTTYTYAPTTVAPVTVHSAGANANHNAGGVVAAGMLAIAALFV
ncbi:hypothetical protein CLIB1423_10S01574 [[Candida] railenensis]|uniref:Uncharacterized protein n=1 Tax=[Candida] railenensis TaxID=45579 RepID=A0A9P0VY45_9ASCO|nr:hypothetical protein CLIB1423_10S01574 [[Candida] railenensis]